MSDGLRPFLTGLFRTAVEAAHPASFLPRLLPTPPKGRIILLAAGKAAGSMVETAERHYLDTLKLPTERPPVSPWRGTATAGPPAW
jgi:hydroxypyruvate reductase